LETLPLGDVGGTYAAQHAGFSASPRPHRRPRRFLLGKFRLGPAAFYPNIGAARGIYFALYEYLGLVNYYWRLNYSKMLEPVKLFKLSEGDLPRS
jgi:hypothetical protein